MRIETDRREGEFRHMGLADDDRTRLAQTAYNRGISGRGGRITANDRTGERRFSGNVEEVLDRNDAPVEGADSASVAQPRIGGIRLGTRLPCINLAENALVACPRFQPRQDAFQPIPYRIHVISPHFPIRPVRLVWDTGDRPAPMECQSGRLLHLFSGCIRGR